jgi:MFS family permease
VPRLLHHILLALAFGVACLVPHAASPHWPSSPGTAAARRRPYLLAAAGGGQPLPPRRDAKAASPLSQPQPPANRPSVLLAVLLALYVSNQWARSLPSFLVSFDAAAAQAADAGHRLMNVGLGFNQAQYGLLVSYGFSLLYTAFSFPAGWACDRLPRTRLLLGAALAWAVATAAQGAARCFWHVLLARVLLGVAQSFSGPAAHTLISDSFPPSHRATANAIYSSGIYLGAALASLSAVLGQAVGWRATSLVVAAASAAPALCLALVIREPPRTPTPPRPPPAAAAGAPAAAAAVARSRPAQVLSVGSVRLVLAAAGARLFSGFAIGAWVAPFYRTHFAAHARQFAILNAAIVAGGGTLATVLGGVLSDRLTSGGRGWTAALVPALGSLLAIPCWVGAMQARVPASARAAPHWSPPPPAPSVAPLAQHPASHRTLCSCRRPAAPARRAPSCPRWAGCWSPTCSPRRGLAPPSPSCKAGCRRRCGAPRRACSTWCRSWATSRRCSSATGCSAAPRCASCSQCACPPATSPAPYSSCSPRGRAAVTNSRQQQTCNNPRAALVSTA